MAPDHEFSCSCRRRYCSFRYTSHATSIRQRKSQENFGILRIDGKCPQDARFPGSPRDHVYRYGAIDMLIVEKQPAFIAAARRDVRENEFSRLGGKYGR